MGQSKWHAARHRARRPHPPTSTSPIHFTPGDPFGARAGVKAFF